MKKFSFIVLLCGFCFQSHAEDNYSCPDDASSLEDCKAFENKPASLPDGLSLTVEKGALVFKKPYFKTVGRAFVNFDNCQGDFNTCDFEGFGIKSISHAGANEYKVTMTDDMDDAASYHISATPCSDYDGAVFFNQVWTIKEDSSIFVYTFSSDGSEQLPGSYCRSEFTILEH